MVKWIETTGRSEQDAISAALFQLGLERDDVSIEVIERAKTGFLGFGSNPAKVRVSYEEENGTPKPLKDLLREEVLSVVKEKPKPAAAAAPVQEASAPAPAPAQTQPAAPVKQAEKEEVEEETILAAKPGWQPPKQSRPARPERRERPAQRSREGRLQEGDELIIGRADRPAPVPAAPLPPADPQDPKVVQLTTFLTGLLERLEVEAVPEVYGSQESGYKVILQGRDLGAIIGRRGETLDAIQQLTNYALNHGQSKRVRVHIDAEGYRAKREESLQRLAVKVAGKVVKYRKNMTLEAMNAYERHVIHATLQDYSNVTTYSTGVEPNRRTVVAYSPGKK